MNIQSKKVNAAVRFYPEAESLNEEGARLFGGAWFGANDEMVAILRSWGIEPSQPSARQFSMLVCLRLGKHFTQIT